MTYNKYMSGTKKFPYSAKQVQWDMTMGTRKYDPEYVRGEVEEFLDAYNRGDLKGIKEEFQDVLFGTQMLVQQATKKDFPLYGADDKVREFYRRNAFLKKLLEDRGVEFHTDYTLGGTNVNKPHKIQEVFRRAGLDLTPEEAQKHSRKYPRFKGASQMHKTAGEIADHVLLKVAVLDALEKCSFPRASVNIRHIMENFIERIAKADRPHMLKALERLADMIDEGPISERWYRSIFHPTENRLLGHITGQGRNITTILAPHMTPHGTPWKKNPEGIISTPLANVNTALDLAAKY